MDILQGVHYQYTSNGQQVGPVEGTQLVQLAQQGHVTAEAHIWTEGMPEWVPATSFNQLAPLFQAQQQQAQVEAQSTQKTASGLSRPISGGGAPTMTRRGNSSRGVGVKRVSGDVLRGQRFHPVRPGASVGLLFTLLLLSIIIFLGTGAIGTALDRRALSNGAPPPSEEPLLWLIFVAVILYFSYFIVSYVYLYRAWKYIQDVPGVARTTPGAAVGFLFIPFFNIYWAFNVYPGWATDYNRYLDAKGATSVPRASSGLAIVTIILMILGVPILHPFMMAGMCKGINNLAKPTDPAL